jgi:hypothetical protein
MNLVVLLTKGGPALANHHTKDKGDLGVAAVIHDLAEHDIAVFLPLSEHQPIDLIAMNRQGQIARIQVKYRKMSDVGAITLYFRSIYSDSSGVHVTPTDLSAIDCFAIYCPENREIYYVRVDDLPSRGSKTITLRIKQPMNHQQKKIRLASRFVDVNRIFANCPRGATG